MPSNFSLETFVHPLRKHLTSNVRKLIFMSVQDNYHDGLEQAAPEDRSFVEVYGSTLEKLLTPDGACLDLVSGNPFPYFGWNRIQLDELAMLFQIAGDIKKVQQINQGIRRLKLTLQIPDKLSNYYPLAQWYLLAGEFSQAIRFAENQLAKIGTSQHPVYSTYSRGSLLGIISRCYEMQGAFEESTKWKLQQLSEEESKDDCYRVLARLYLKAGQFGTTADIFRSFSHWRDDGDIRWLATSLRVMGGDRGVAVKLVEDLWPRYQSGYAGGAKTFKWLLEEDFALTRTLEEQGFFETEARVYEIIGQPLSAARAWEQAAEKYEEANNKGQANRFWRRAARIYAHELSIPIHDVILKFKQKGHIEGAVIEALVRECREKGRLAELADALKDSGFFEEAAKIYDDLGQASTKSKSESTQRPKESKPTTGRAAAMQSVCPSCDSEVKANWLECPECGASLKEVTCQNCREPLEPHWKRCPACKTTVTNLN